MHIASRLSICTDQGPSGNATHARGEAAVLQDHCNLWFFEFLKQLSCDHFAIHGKQSLVFSLTH